MLPTILLFASSLLPCRYTVRDVGFVDLGDPPYRLVTYAAKGDGPLGGENLALLSAAMLTDSNVEGRVLDPDGALDEEDEQRLSARQVQRFPFTTLIGPAGRELVLPWGGLGDDPSAAAGRLFHTVLRSPARDAISEALIESYCVVVLIEGLHDDANDAARAAIAGALAELTREFDSMPKDVGESPRQVVVPAERHAEEAVLLWSLGLEAPGGGGPAVAVLFGRGRLVGSLLRGEALNARELYRLLAVVGLDCECGLDRGWMRGPRIPLRWDASLRQHSANRLGFDPDSPRVRAEVASILDHASTDIGSAPRLAPRVDDLLLAYREESVERDSLAPPAPGGSPGLLEEAASEPRDHQDTALKSLLIVFSAIAGLSVICSVVVLLKARPQ